MKIFNKFIWSKKEPSNKNDIWFDGSTWRMYTEEAWQSFTLPVDAADTLTKMLENASEVYQEKLNAGYGIVIEGNTISVDDSIKYDDNDVWEAIETLQQNKVEQIQLNDYVPLDRWASTSQVMMDNISELNSIKLNKTDVATINGKVLTEGGNILIEGGESSHNIGSIDLFEQIIAQKQNHNLTLEDKEAILNGKVITASTGNGAVPAISITSIEGLGLMLMFHFNERLYSMCVMWNNDRCYINGFFSFSVHSKLYADSELSEISENAVQNKVVTEKLAELSAEVSNLVGGNIAIPLPSYVVGEYWNAAGDTIQYGDSPAPCRYQPIDVSEYIGKNATITIRWNGTPEPSSWLFLLFFKPTNYPLDDGKGFIKEVDCYNAATNGVYTFDVEVVDKYLFLSKRYESTEINLDIAIKGEIDTIVAEQAEQVVKGDYGYNGQDLSWNWGYLSANGGLIEGNESSGRKYTDLTPCIGGSMVRYRGETDHSAIAGIAFYNSQGEVISAESNVGNINEEHSVQVPNGAAFFRLSINLSYQSEESVYVRFDKSIADVALSAYAAANKGGVAYVATNGSDANDGASQDTAYATIQRAIDGGASVIYVAPSTYTSSFEIRNKDSVTILPIGYGEYTHANPNTPKIVIDGNNSLEYGCLASNVKQLKIVGIDFINFTRSVVQLKNIMDLYLLDCVVKDNQVYNGFNLVNVNGVLESCSAINIYDDGFNIHGYGCTHFINCTALNCHDDGISHHDGSTGFIEGGEYSGSGKAGIAPAYGANVNIANVVCKNNAIGIGYLTTENGHARMKGIVSNALLVGNKIGLKVDELCDVVAYNNKYKDNEQDKAILGNVEDYDL